MPWITTVEEKNATGVLARIYANARRRVGKVFNIVRVQSINPGTLRAGIGLYQESVLAESPISRAHREMIAVVVSRTNDCHY